MPQLPLIGVQSLVAPTDVAGGSGGRGTNEMLGAIEGGIGSAGSLVQRQQAAAKALAEKQAHDEAQVAVTNAVSAEHMASLKSVTDAANSGSMAGFTDQWQKDFDQRTAEAAKTIPKVGQSLYQEQVARLRGQLGASFYEKEMGARSIQLTRDQGAGIDSDANVVYIDRSRALDLLGRRLASIDTLSVPDAEKSKLAEQASQTIGYSAGANWVQADPKGFLAHVGNVDTFKGDPVLSGLKPENLQRLTQHAQTLLAQQQNAADHAADQAERIGQQAFDELTTFVNAGSTPDLNYVARVTAATKGTTSEVATREVLARANAQAGFGSQSLPRQQQVLAKLDALFSTSGTDPENAKMRANLGAIAEKQQAAFKDDPLQAYAQFGKGPAAVPQQVASVEDGLKLVAARAPLMSGAEAYGGVAGVSPLHPQEAEQLGRAIRQLPLEQQASALSQIGGSLGSEARISALAKQIGDKDGTLGQAMALEGQRTSQGRDASFFLLRGEQAIKDKTVLIDSTKATGWRATIADEIRGAYPNEQLADAAIEAAFKMTVGLDASGVASANPKRGVMFATGGIIKHGAADAKIPLPYGIQSESEFEKRIDAIKPADLQSQAPDSFVFAGRAMVPLESFVKSLSNATLEHAGQGRYTVRAGTGYVTNAAGAPIILQVKP